MSEISDSNSSAPFVRRFKRYRVDKWKHIEALLDRNRDSEQLVMIGNGGCGFYGFQRGYPNTVPHRVFCKFRLKGEGFENFEPVVLQGNVIYTRPVELETLRVYFHGVEFIPSERDKVTPIIQVLESLHAVQKIEVT